MKANELRIGNLLAWEDEPNRLLIVSEIGFNNRKNKWVRFENGDGSIIEDEFSQLNPIPLTEEWLVKFGFEDRSRTTDLYFIKGEFILGGSMNRLFPSIHDEFGLNAFGIEIEHVHQLQNLYFALTGVELELK
jgi:hypothetical protein